MYVTTKNSFANGLYIQDNASMSSLPCNHFESIRINYEADFDRCCTWLFLTQWYYRAIYMYIEIRMKITIKFGQNMVELRM